MIANPTIPAYRYDPYGRILTREQYDHQGATHAPPTPCLRLLAWPRCLSTTASTPPAMCCPQPH